jgi:hypothetical protein
MDEWWIVLVNDGFADIMPWINGYHPWLVNNGFMVG